jgi:asparagine synthase (glutamine-hydrolysing)
MGGLCGWIPSGHAGRERLDEIRAAMTRALRHRGAVSWLDGSDAATAADSARDSPQSIEARWSSAGPDAPAFPAVLEGTFALAALDRRGGRLLLARDRLGERPLYYAVTDDGIAFASEMKAILAAGVVRDRSVLPEAVDAYLALAYIPAPWTILAAIRKVPSGHAVLIPIDGRPDPGRAPDAVRYWTLPERTGTAAGAAEMLAQLDQALERRLPGAGPIACFLSGGLDSSLVASLAARRLAGSGRRLLTFSVGFAEAGLDESAHAREVARDLGADHREIRLEEVSTDVVRRITYHLDEPMADAACIPNWTLASSAGAVAPVALTGDGADALLAGDHWFRRVQRLDRMAVLPAAALRAVPAVARLAGARAHRRYRRLVELAHLEPAARYLGIREKWSREERGAIYAAPFRARVAADRVEASFLGAAGPWRAGRSVEAAVRLDTLHALPDGLLMKADKMGMAHGVELRSPFLDSRFVEWAARLPIESHLRGSVSKYLLKRAAETLLPRRLVYRRKHGFQVPIGRWLRGALRSLTEAAFEAPWIARQGIFDAAAMASLKRRFDSGPPAPVLDGRVWQIVALQTWWRATLS